MNWDQVEGQWKEINGKQFHEFDHEKIKKKTKHCTRSFYVLRRHASDRVGGTPGRCLAELAA